MELCPVASAPLGAWHSQQGQGCTSEGPPLSGRLNADVGTDHGAESAPMGHWASCHGACGAALAWMSSPSPRPAQPP